MSASIEQRKQRLLSQALPLIEGKRIVKFELEMGLVVGLIGQLQLAFRPPDNNGPTRQTLEQFARDLIERIDPSHGPVWELLNLGFDPEYDE